MLNVSSIIKIVAGLLIWFLIHSIIFGIAGMDGGAYILDDNYVIHDWPGRIWRRYENTKSFSPEPKIESKIDKFAVTESYIFLKAGTEWYTINRQSREISQFDSLGAMKSAVKIKSDIYFSSSKPWLRMAYFWPAISISIPIGVFIFILFFSKEIKSFILPLKSSGNNIESK